MAGSSFFALIDDIASILDDVSAMTKIAARKTAGVLGDDLALNAQQVSGVNAERELPVVWAVAVGSLKNKAILVPAALLISAVAPWAVTPLLMLGGAFLCFEGVEKLAARYLPHAQAPLEEHASGPGDSEQNKIKGAIRTDFVLSAEIVAITLGTVAGSPLQQQIVVLVGIALIMTLGVYGVVAAIVKLDDGGLYLLRSGGDSRFGRFRQSVGRAILHTAPHLMKSLTVIGTIAMFLVGGGILTHGVVPLHHWMTELGAGLASVPVAGGPISAVAAALMNAGVGVLAGAAILLVLEAGKRGLRRWKKA